MMQFAPSIQNMSVIITNLFFLFPAVRAFGRAEYIYGVIYALIPFTSGSFHTCDEFQNCAFPFTYQRDLDYFFALLMLPMTGLYIVHWGHVWKPLKDILLLLFAILLAFCIYWGGGTSLGGMVLFAVISVAIPVVYWAGYMTNACMDHPNEYNFSIVCCCAEESKRVPGGRYFPKYEWGNLFAGVALTAMGVILFITQVTLVQSYWWAIHSLWHCVEAFGQWYILGCKAPPPIAAYHIIGRPLSFMQKSLVKNHLLSDLLNDIKRDPWVPIQIQISLE